MIFRSEDLTGKKFGPLKVIARSETKKSSKWLCECELCGTVRPMFGFRLRNGTAKCLCFGGRERHGMYVYKEGRPHPLYCVWTDMKQRCSHQRFNRYAGRGIQVCDEWRLSFPAFMKWCLENGWREGLEIDRKNNDGNYEPSNCRFVTRTVNCRNKSTNRHLTFNGETLILIEWAERMGVKPSILHNRLRRGWSVERTLGTEVK